MVSECMGKLTLVDPQTLMASLQQHLNDPSPLARSTVVTAIKFTISDQVPISLPPSILCGPAGSHRAIARGLSTSLCLLQFRVVSQGTELSTSLCLLQFGVPSQGTELFFSGPSPCLLWSPLASLSLPCPAKDTCSEEI